MNRTRVVTGFIAHPLPVPTQAQPASCARNDKHPLLLPPLRMAVAPGRVPLSTGAALLTLLLTNRLLTPLASLTPQQSRADIIGVATAATLLLYGLTRLDITPSSQPVPLDGVDLRYGFDDGTGEIEWMLDACLRGCQHLQSVALLGKKCYLVGRFRDGVQEVSISEGGIVEGALEKGERAYLADMKVVPAKEVEFSYLPEKVQAVLILPIGENALVVGADKARPFKGKDFGWLQAIADRLGTILEDG